MFFPDGSADQYDAFDELQRLSVSPQVAYRLHRMFDDIDVTREWAQVTTPTLVMHLWDDGVVPFEEGRLLAALTPKSRFVPLEGHNHIPLSGEPASAGFFDELRRFLNGIGTEGVSPGASRMP